MASTPKTDKKSASEKKNVSAEEIGKLRGSLQKALETIDPKLLGVRGGTVLGNQAEPPAVDVNVCKSKCM